VQRGSTLLLLAFVAAAGCATRPDVVLETLTTAPEAPAVSAPAVSGQPTSPVLPDGAPAPAGAPATAPPSTAPPLRSFTLAASGDILLHTSVIDMARQYAAGSGATYDFAPMFADVQPVIAAADLGICHLETPVAPPGEALSTYPIYGVPAEIVGGIKAAGFDRCSLASNHSMDRGTKGIDATLTALDAAGLGHTGMARRPEESLPSHVVVNGVRVAHLSYTFGFNGLSLPRAEPWRSNLIEPQRIIAEARQAKADGAEFVVLSLHWGWEGHSPVTPEQRALADVLTRSGAIDLIIGHHAHVLQPIQTVNGRWVVFGLGNFISGMGGGTKCCGAGAQDGAIVRVTVTENPGGFFVAGRPEIVPTYVDRARYVIEPVATGLNDPAVTTALRGGLQQSLARTQKVLGEYLVASP
jgi:poly-gamma-glutamate capsule biosynthesis protein CapA/YwtB (metallophosphatase superfamily)